MDEDAEEIQRVHRKRRNTIIESSSDENEESNKRKKTPDNKLHMDIEDGGSSSRSSARIAKKRSRSFEMPTRDSVWKDITLSKSAHKYHQLAPRKLVNNFTRENHRYNYDPNYTSGEESMDDFIVDSDPYESSSLSRMKKQKTTKKRVKNRKERVIVESSSDSDSEVSKSSSVKRDRSKRRPTIDTSEKSSSEYSDQGPIDSSKKQKKSTKLKSSSSDSGHNNESGFEDNANANDKEDNTDEEMFLTPLQKRRKSNVLNSDVESDAGDAETLNQSKSSDTQHTAISMQSDKSETDKRGPCVDDNTRENKASGSGCTVEDDNSGDKTSEVTSKTEGADGSNVSCSDDESGSDSDAEEVCSSRARVQMLKKKKAKRELFERFKEERNRKLSKQGKNG